MADQHNPDVWPSPNESRAQAPASLPAARCVRCSILALRCRVLRYATCSRLVSPGVVEAHRLGLREIFNIVFLEGCLRQTWCPKRWPLHLHLPNPPSCMPSFLGLASLLSSVAVFSWFRVDNDSVSIGDAPMRGRPSVASPQALHTR